MIKDVVVYVHLYMCLSSKASNLTLSLFLSLAEKKKSPSARPLTFVDVCLQEREGEDEVGAFSKYCPVAIFCTQVVLFIAACGHGGSDS